jgi:hypothetical protein
MGATPLDSNCSRHHLTPLDSNGSRHHQLHHHHTHGERYEGKKRAFHPCSSPCMHSTGHATVFEIGTCTVSKHTEHEYPSARDNA